MILSNIPKYSNDDDRRRNAVYLFMKFIGVNIGDSPKDVSDQVLFAFRYFPVSYLLSAIVIGKLADGFSYRQLTRKFPITLREVRTVVKRHRMLHKDPIFTKKH